jgi:hypothetical protein
MIWLIRNFWTNVVWYAVQTESTVRRFVLGGVLRKVVTYWQSSLIFLLMLLPWNGCENYGTGTC